MSDNALPVADQPAASEPAANEVEQAAASAPEQTAEKPAEPAPEEAKQEEKPAKTPEQREIDRMRRKIDRLVRQREELRAMTQQQPRGLAQPQQDVDNGRDASDSDTLTLSRAEAARLIEQRARELAPRLTEQQAVIEHRQKVVGRLAAEWGQEKFDALASDLDDAFGGLRGTDNVPRPAVEAIFEADDPKALIEHLADPENSDEAAALSRMSAVAAGRAIARLEAKLAADKAKAKPEPSKVPAPIEAVRGTGSVTKDPSEMTDAEFAKWRRAQIKSRN